MAKIMILEQYKGELNGSYQTLYIAVSETGNLFETHELELKRQDNKTLIDFKATRWTPITNERHHQISEEMHGVYKKKFSRSQKNQEALELDVSM